MPAARTACGTDPEPMDIVRMQSRSPGLTIIIDTRLLIRLTLIGKDPIPS
jgi:hypothetical protein